MWCSGELQDENEMFRDCGPRDLRRTMSEADNIQPADDAKFANTEIGGPLLKVSDITAYVTVCNSPENEIDECH